MNNDPTNDPDDQNLARWIRAAAPIGKPSAARREAAFKAVHDEWQAALQAGDQPDDRTADRPQTRLAPPSNRRGWSIAIAASLVLAISVLSPLMFTKPVVAQVADVRGSGGFIKSSGIQAWWGARRPLTQGEELREGESIETDTATFVRVSVSNDVSVRVAGNTQLQLSTPNQFDLTNGDLYIESALGLDQEEAPLTIRTALGDVAHLGTRYLVSQREDNLQVFVREGLVKLDTRAGERHLAAEGQGLQLRDINSTPTLSTIDAFDPAFAWLAEIPAPLNKGPLSLDVFFEWYEIETGKPLSLQGDGSFAAPEQVMLRGNVQGLSPDKALDVVALSSDLVVERQKNSTLVYPTSQR
jgi:ferric-dicitrate binding protein FerR (iron transport regulator)